MYNDMIGTIGLKVVSSSPNVTCVRIIRKYNHSSMAEIINNIKNNEYILVCSAIDTSNIKKIRRCYNELVKNGIKAELYEFDKISTLELITNLIYSQTYTNLEVQAQVDSEIENE